MINQEDIIQINEDGKDREYEYNGMRYPSVTSIISKVCPKPALPPWAFKVGIEGAIRYVQSEIEGLSGLEDMTDSDILNFLQGNLNVNEIKSYLAAKELDIDAAMNKGGSRGVDVHTYIEKMIKGEELPEVTDEVQQYINTFEQWCEDYDPLFHESELMVVSPSHKFGGTFDGTITIRNHPKRKRHPDLTGMTVVGDYKTNKDGKVYAEQHLPQVEAYKYAYENDMGMGKVDGAVVIGIGPAKNGKACYQTTLSYYTFENFLCLKRTFEQNEIARLRNPLARKK